MPKRQTQNQFITIATLKHNNKYDYSKVIYINNNTFVIIICPIHGEFNQRPRSHVNEGKGCYQCGRDALYLSTEDFIQTSEKIHGNKYDYSNTEYFHSHNDVKINCPKHGEFLQQASRHLAGAGCAQCAIDGRFFSQEEFIQKSNEVHNFKFDYSEVNYISSHVNITIICSKHGYFYQRPDHHLSGHGCDSCRSSISKMEIAWLNSLGIAPNFWQKTIIIENRKFKVDAFCPETNTIYEYYGDYWHGNPVKFDSEKINTKLDKKFGELYSKTIERENILRQAGFTIKSIWQSDFN